MAEIGGRAGQRRAVASRVAPGEAVSAEDRSTEERSLVCTKAAIADSMERQLMTLETIANCRSIAGQLGPRGFTFRASGRALRFRREPALDSSPFANTVVSASSNSGEIRNLSRRLSP
jgi:hypothetical protein